MPQDLPLTVKDAAAALRAGSVSSVQLTEGFLNRISLLNESLGAFVAVCGESALKAAEAADWDFAAGVDRGLLQGIPLAVKDIIAMAEELIPSFQSIKRGNQSPEMEEERRNCFVAITRTKEQLTLSAARFYKGWPKQPSRFLAEMGLAIIRP